MPSLTRAPRGLWTLLRPIPAFSARLQACHVWELLLGASPASVDSHRRWRVLVGRIHQAVPSSLLCLGFLFRHLDNGAPSMDYVFSATFAGLGFVLDCLATSVRGPVARDTTVCHRTRPIRSRQATTKTPRPHKRKEGGTTVSCLGCYTTGIRQIYTPLASNGGPGRPRGRAATAAFKLEPSCREDMCLPYALPRPMDETHGDGLGPQDWLVLAHTHTLWVRLAMAVQEVPQSPPPSPLLV